MSLQYREVERGHADLVEWRGRLVAGTSALGAEAQRQNRYCIPQLRIAHSHPSAAHPHRMIRRR